MFHKDFLGVDANGSTYTAEVYFARSTAESLFFDVEDEPYPGGGVAMGTVLIGGNVQRFSHVWLQTPQGWRLVATHSSPIGSRPNASPATRVTTGDETDHIKDQATRSTTEAAVIDAMRRVQRAERASDANGWAALTADTFWAISPYGQKDRKPARFSQIARQAATATATPLPTVHDVQIGIYGDLAVMHYVQEPVTPPAMRATRVWVRHGAVWQQALNHQTRLTQPGRK